MKSIHIAFNALILADLPLHSRDVDRLATDKHALGCRGRKPGADKFDQHLDGEAVRNHQRLGAPVGAGGQQVERAAGFAGDDVEPWPL